MPIKVACSCGQNLAAPDTLAGKKAKCPKCGRLITIPSPSTGETGQSFNDLLDEVGMTASRTGVRCPSCSADMPRDAALCVQCGYDVQKGQHIQTDTEDNEQQEEEDEFAGQYESHGVEGLDRAEREILRLKKQEKFLAKGVPWWAILLTLAVLIYFLVRMVTTPQDQAMRETGLAAIAAAGLSAFVYYIVLIVIAFREHVRCGLFFLFVPFYLLYYAITRWTKCKSAFNYLLASSLAVVLGVGMLMLAPSLAEDEEKKSDPGRGEDSETAHVLPTIELTASRLCQPHRRHRSAEPVSMWKPQDQA